MHSWGGTEAESKLGHLAPHLRYPVTLLLDKSEDRGSERKRGVFGKGMGNAENANERPKQVFSKSAFPLSEEVFRKRKDQDVSKIQTQIWTG